MKQLELYCLPWFKRWGFHDLRGHICITHHCPSLLPWLIQMQWQRASQPLWGFEDQFTWVLGHQTATQLFKLVHEYRPEPKQESMHLMLAQAKKKAAGKGEAPTKGAPELWPGLILSPLQGKNEKAWIPLSYLPIFLPAWEGRFPSDYQRIGHGKSCTTFMLTEVNSKTESSRWVVEQWHTWGDLPPLGRG